jgi:two-component system chemotaxis response regulator CheY
MISPDIEIKGRSPKNMPKILIVDDSKLSRRILRGMLEPHGYAVVEAEDGIVALERYFLDKPDLVLLDLTLEGMYGIDVLKKLKELDPGARVIIASADIQKQTHALANEAGALNFIDKPFLPEQVVGVVDAALKGAP